MNWNLRVNPDKCQCILFRRSIGEQCPTQSINAIKPDTGQREPIPREKVVKYLGAYLDDMLRIFDQYNNQYEKARRAFLAEKKIFMSKNINKKAKLICYQLLVRSILTYAAPIWWNMNSSLMERLKRLERDCLRRCLGINRTSASNFKKRISNHKLYNTANIPRVDTLIIQITRDYFQKNTKSTNPLIYNNSIMSTEEWNNNKLSGYIPPPGFTKCDAYGLIQTPNNIPSIYHRSRHCKNKKIDWTKDEFTTNPAAYFIYY